MLKQYHLHQHEKAHAPPSVPPLFSSLKTILPTLESQQFPEPLKFERFKFWHFRTVYSYRNIASTAYDAEKPINSQD